MTITKYVSIGIFIIFSALALSLFQNCEQKSLDLGGDQPSTCPNGAINPPLCNNFTQNTCPNGATNPPLCDNNQNQNSCDNGAINFPYCNDFNNNNDGDLYLVVSLSKSGTEPLAVVNSSNTHYLKIYNGGTHLAACAELIGSTGCVYNGGIRYFPMDDGCSYANGLDDSGNPIKFCGSEPNTTSSFYTGYDFSREEYDGLADQSDYDTKTGSYWKYNVPGSPHYDSNVEDYVWWKQVSPMELEENLSITLYYSNPNTNKVGNFTYTISQ